MTQKRFSIVQGGQKTDVSYATDATSLGSDIARLIVVDTVSRKELFTAVENLLGVLKEKDFPLS